MRVRVGVILSLVTATILGSCEWFLEPEDPADDPPATYSVTYQPNGADGGAVPVDDTQYTAGNTVTVLGNTGGLARDGYSFVGWNTASDGDRTAYTTGATFAMPAVDVALYATWSPNPTFTVTYDENGADSGTVPVDTMSYEEGATVTVLGNIGGLRKTGSEFAGWNTAAIGTGTDRAPGDTFAMPAADRTLYAQWSPFSFVAATPTETANYKGIAFGGGLFAAINFNGTNRVMTSADGITWTARSAAEANAWFSLTYGDGLFVAVSTNGTNRVMTSADGATWTARAAAAANDWVSVTHGDGMYVAVSLNGANQVMTSPDGTIWTARTATEAASWSSVSYGNGVFVAVNQAGGVMTSPDGITWTSRTAAETNSWQSVTFGDGLFVAVANSGTNRVMTSPDGVTWTARQAAEANQWVNVTYGDGLFVAVSTTGTNRAMTSADGTTWTATPAATDNSWEAVAYGNGRFVAVGAFGATDRVMYAVWGP